MWSSGHLVIWSNEEECMLTVGARLGTYEVIAKIGEGGMGQVYRARDTKLNRDVALKILPEAFASDPERLARFTREAQTLASLNHPNIAAIFAIEEGPAEAGHHVRALVMELVEGEDLSQRIEGLRAKGSLLRASGASAGQAGMPLDEALPIAKQIADALEAAHGQGIIHRDLKPANIKVRADGTVKVLDFGLAKAMEPPAGSSPSMSMSPTLTTPAMMTGVGTILGTAAYMSPEQARGRAVDKRTDIWAFGCVLYEMLTGRRPFEAEDVSMTLASVMMKEPEWTALGDDIPPHIRNVVKRCLEKDRKLRLADIAVAQFLINEPPPAPVVIEAPPQPVAAAPVPKRASLARLVVVGFASVVALAAAVGATWWMLRPAAPQPVRFSIVPPSTQPLTIHGFQRDIAITPDGRQIVYRVGPAGTVGTQLVVRSLDQLDARLLTGFTGIRSPFISPDGHWIGFFEVTSGELKKVSILGGPPITLCKFVGLPFEASWGPDDTIVFATSDASTGLLSVAAGGGEPKVLTKPDTARGETDHGMPFILPRGRAVLLTITMQGQPIDNAQVAVLDLKTGQKKTLIRGGSDARYVDTGHLVYAAAGTLRAVRFDLGRLEVTSDPVPVLEKVTMSGTTGTADFVLAQNGTLVYVPGGMGGGLARSLAWVSRQGKEEPIKAAPPRAYVLPRLSPDGTRVALDIRDQDNDVWVWDLKRETLARVTFDPGPDRDPVWTSDSRRIVFDSPRGGTGGTPNLYWQAADNTGTVERLTTSQNPQYTNSISPDGRHLLFVEQAPNTTGDIEMLTLDAARKSEAAPLVATTFSELNAEVSPDGRWVAYQSNESGKNQVYVRPFPKVDAGHWQVSTAGGTRPLWARSGRELFYELDSALMAVPVQTTGAIFGAGNPAKLFNAAPYYFGNALPTYDVSADGQRFLMIKLADQSSTGTAASMVVVEHWTEELKARVPAK
jgi:serine/threonine-protein kinase